MRGLKSRLSIATFVIVFLVLAATVMLVGMGLFSHMRESAQERRKLAQKLATSADQLAAGLSLPLWNFDYTQVAKILDSTMQDRDVFGIVVTQTDPVGVGKQITYARSRGHGWSLVQEGPDVTAPGLLQESREIVAMGDSIGSVKIYITTRFLDQDLRERLNATLVLALAFDLLMVASLYLLLWMVVLKPLRSIERFAVAVKSGGAIPKQFKAGGFQGELESLRLSIGDMVTLLQSRMRAILDKETTLRAVLDSIPQAVYWKDAQGRFLGCNKVFAGMAGCESGESILGRHELELPFRGEDVTVHQADDLEIVRTGEPRIHVLESLVSPDGKVFWLDMTKVPIRGDDGKPYGVLGVLEDITERKVAEEEHARLQEQLNQSQKLESVGRLAGGVAHDNNNMLTAILMHAELMKEQLGAEHPAVRHIKAMEGAAQRSAALIRQLLAFSRKQVIEPRIVDLNELLEGFRKSMAPLVGEDVEFVLNLGRDLWTIKVDPAQMDQIVMNLVVNARDAMPEGGTLSIETGNVTIHEDYCQENPWAQPGEYVMLCVSDTGVGMTAEVKRKIFEPFFTTKDLGKGTGLGLSTVFGIVKQNDGFLNVYSEPDLGATFRIYFPRCHQVGSKELDEESVNAYHGQGNILVVEDDESLREVIPRILERLGYTFILADHPQHALEICQNLDAPIDVVLTDVVMPGMSGKELWEKATRIRPTARVIYMSGYTADVISRQGVLDTGVQFIQKPFSTVDLGKKIRSVLGAPESH